MTLKVTMIGHTVFYPYRAKEALGYIPQEEYLGVEDAWLEWENVMDNSDMDPEYEGRVAAARDKASDLEDLIPSGSDELPECAGRNCYQAWGRPRPETATNEGYLGNILSQGHYSVLEHSSVTVAITGVSTSLLGQLSRHRHLSFSVLSKRYVDESHSESVIHPGLTSEVLQHAVQEHHKKATDLYTELVEILVNLDGKTRKEAREIARGVLPQATETRMVVTGNLRAWRDVLGKRLHPAADAEIQAFARKMLTILKGVAPNSFQDLEIND